MKEEKSVAIVVCFMGRFPWFFNYFLHSCGYNLSIDFFIISDQASPPSAPSNVKFIYKTMDEINTIAQERLGFSVNIQNGYKLCDFKPAYGFLFPDIVEKYDFWGHSDVDIIFGEIRNFLDAKLLNSYDYISIRDDYTTGCFSLYRNTEYVNTLFKKSKDYHLVFSSSEHYCFDECNFKHDLIADGTVSIFDIETEIESFTHIIKAEEAANSIRVHFDFLLLEGLPGKIRFKEGKVVYRNKYEAILYHLYWLKRTYKPTTIKKISSNYRISKTRIYS